jgi:hypothetical protein
MQSNPSSGKVSNPTLAPLGNEERKSRKFVLGVKGKFSEKNPRMLLHPE